MPTKPSKLDFSKSEVVRRAEAGSPPESSSHKTKPKPTERSLPGSDSFTAALTFFLSACTCTFLFFANPKLQPFEFYRLVNCAVLLWLPIMTIILLMKQDVQMFGMSRGDKAEGLRLTGWAIVLMIVPLVFVSLTPNFREYYGNSLAQPLAMSLNAINPLLPQPIQPLGLAYYELAQGFYFFCWEFFFRGFMLFGLSKAKNIGTTGAIILQAIPFALLHWSIDPAASKPPIEIASALFGGLILGWLAIRTKSFFYGYLIHWAIALILDLMIIAPLLFHSHS